MAHQLPPLPYEKNALTPHISEETFDYHYGKHHQAYVTNLNGLINGTPYEDMTLEDIVRNAPAGGIYNNAAQTLESHLFLVFDDARRRQGSGWPACECHPSKVG